MRSLPKRRRRSFRWAINPHPIFRAFTQTFADRIHQNVAGLLFQFVIIAKPVIKEVALPGHTVFGGHELFPILHHRCHAWLAREREDGVQMIRHEQAQAAMPDEFVVIMGGIRPESLSSKTERMVEAVEQVGREINGERLISLSAGEAFFPEDGQDAEQLLAEADRRMYLVKQEHHRQSRLPFALPEMSLPTAIVQ